MEWEGVEGGGKVCAAAIRREEETRSAAHRVREVHDVGDSCERAGFAGIGERRCG